MVSDEESCQQAGRLADELSSALIGLTDDITGAIEHAQCRIAEALDADRTTLIEFSDGAVRETYQWASDDSPAVDVHAHALRLTWLLDRSGADGGTVAIERIPDELPREAVTPGFLEYLREIGGADSDRDRRPAGVRAGGRNGANRASLAAAAGRATAAARRDPDRRAASQPPGGGAPAQPGRGRAADSAAGE
jgi:hypothetical protein